MTVFNLVRNIIQSPVPYVICEYTTSGTRTINVSTGLYKLEMVGSGAGSYHGQYTDSGGWTYHNSSGGASGASIVCWLYMSGTYSVTVGSGTAHANAGSAWALPAGNPSYVKQNGNQIIRCDGGQTSDIYANKDAYYWRGNDSIVTFYTTPFKIIHQMNGIQGTYAKRANGITTTVTGGASTYNGYGAGGDYNSSGGDGYFKLSLLQAYQDEYILIRQGTQALHLARK